MVRVSSATIELGDEPQPRTPAQRVYERLPQVSFSRVDPASPMLSPRSLLSPRRRLSVSFVRRSSKFAATRTEVSIDVGPLQILLLVCFLASCSAYGVAVPGFGLFFPRVQGRAGSRLAATSHAGVSRSAVASSGSASTLLPFEQAHAVSRRAVGSSLAPSANGVAKGVAARFPMPATRQRRLLLETLECAAATAATRSSRLPQPLWRRPSAPIASPTRSASAASASWAVRASLLSGALGAEHRLRAVLSGGSGPLAACACLTAFLSETACSILFPGQFGRLRIAYGGGRRAWSEAALAAAEARLHAALASGSGRDGSVEGGLGNLTVQSRVKSLRSVFEKRILRGSDAVDDLLALRVIVEPQHRDAAGDAEGDDEGDAEGDDEGDDEAAASCGLGPREMAAAEAACMGRLRDVEALVRNLWPGAVEATKDYVSEPKRNGYRSVHVLLRLPGSGERLEVQIRTRCMHEHAERGAAAHAQYKAAELLTSVSGGSGGYGPSLGGGGESDPLASLLQLA